MNPRARWDAMAMYDRRDFNGTELRAFAGNFLYSTGANEVAGRHTLGHFDLPLRDCTVALDGARRSCEDGRALPASTRVTHRSSSCTASAAATTRGTRQRAVLRRARLRARIAWDQPGYGDSAARRAL